MQTTKRDALLQAIKTWLFPPQPKPQVFLNLLTTDNLRSPQAIKASLQVNRAEIAASSAKITKELTNDFAAWRENYPVYAVKLQNDAVNEEVDIENEKNFRKPQPTIDEETSGLKGEFSIEDAAERFERSINALFNSEEFREIRDQIIKLLPPKGQHQPDVYIRYDDPHLAELPLHLWNEFQDRDIEPVFSSKETKPQKFSDKKKHKPRILLILGDFIDIKNDNEKLNWQKEYSNADIKVLELLNEKGINNALLKEKWDVLYFGGHSTTEYGKGILYLKDGKHIVLDDFQRSLTTAAQNGLQLVILNSCNSLGAAHALQSAGVPMVVATRHLIHNRIAPEFLEYFLDSYLNIGQSLKDAVGHARYLLKSQHPEFPCASWLPVVFQSPSFFIQPKPSPLIVPLITCIVAFIVWTIHTSGMLQGSELSLYDHMMASKVSTPLNPNIVIIKTTPEDVEWQENQGEKLVGDVSISDKFLLQLIQKLDKEKPKVIGMAFAARKGISNSSSKEIKSLLDGRMLNDAEPTLINNCRSLTDGESDYYPEVMGTRNLKPEKTFPLGDPRVGFTNLNFDDKPPLNLRRILLMQYQKNSKCGTKAFVSFPLRIVLSFLNIQDTELFTSYESYALDSRIDLKVRDIKISNIIKGEGGYQVDPAYSNNALQRFSILLNRKYDRDMPQLNQYTLKEALSGIDLFLKDKIVIIGGIGRDITIIDNVYKNALVVDHLLNVFKTKNYLQGASSNLSLVHFGLNLFISTSLLYYLSTRFAFNQFLLFLFFVIVNQSIIYLIYFYTLDKMLLWIPSIPIFIGTAFCAICISITTQMYSSIKQYNYKL